MKVQASDTVTVNMKEAKLTPGVHGFTEKEIKRAKKKLKKAGIPKEFWFVELYNKDTGDLIKYWL